MFLFIIIECSHDAVFKMCRLELRFQNLPSKNAPFACELEALDLLQVSSSDLSKKTRESERGKIKRARENKNEKKKEGGGRRKTSERGKRKRSRENFPSLFLFSLARFLKFFSRDQRMRLVASPWRPLHHIFHSFQNVRA